MDASASPPCQRIASSTVRARDKAVSRSAPERMSTSRPVGKSPTQNDFVQKRIQQLQDEGAEFIRVNQQQVNFKQQRVGVNRPDLQYNLNGRRYYEEYDTVASGRGPGHWNRIEDNDPLGVIILFVVN